MEEPTYKQHLERPGKMILYRRLPTQAKPAPETQPGWVCKLLNPTTDPEFRYICSAVNLTRRILCHDKAIKHMAEIGGYVSEKFKIQGAPVLRTSTQEANQKWIKETFLPDILTEFPPLYVDEQIDNPRVLAFTHSGSKDADFIYSYQKSIVVLLNAANVALMKKVAGDKSKNGQDLKLLIWYLAQTLVHEVGGHVLVKHLTLAKENTPLEVRDLDDQGVPRKTSDKVGESGFNLEALLFGGKAWLLYPKDGKEIEEDQLGKPYLVYHPHGETKQVAKAISLDEVDNAFKSSE